MNDWLQNLELAFQSHRLALVEWLPIVETGLSHLSVGIVPPAIDQVLVGTIDRSRNPDLRFALVLGMNEGVFPAAPEPVTLLSQSDRETLASFGAALGPDRHEQLGIERYYGYIACTRARERLVLTYSRRDAKDRDPNPSPFVDHLKHIFPGLNVENYEGTLTWNDAEHSNELVVPLLKLHVASPQAITFPAPLIDSHPAFKLILTKWSHVAAASAKPSLSPDLAQRMYGKELHTTVSALEDFAACPFRFFAARGLRAEERMAFEVDHREKGSFQHEMLREFHRRFQEQGKRWRDVDPAEARELMGRIGAELLPVYREGIFLASQSERFTAWMLIEGLQKLVETLIGWAPQNQFDPQAVEVSFGLKESRLPAWRIDLDGEHALLLRGRIDRVDVCRIEDTGEALGVVIDYKSSERKLEPVKLQHGLELQLLSYLGALSELEKVGEELHVSRLLPAGVFYVCLKGGGGSAATRHERESARKPSHQHLGRFDGGHLDRFDNRGQSSGDQFKFAKNKDGTFSRRGNDALPTAEFQELVVSVKEFLRQHGRAIYAGCVDVAPYRWNGKTACDYCAYRAVCRFDPWTQPFRVLRPLP